jgi:hypothetical protein
VPATADVEIGGVGDGDGAGVGAVGGHKSIVAGGGTWP